MLVAMVYAAFSFCLFAVLSFEIWFSSFSEDAYAHILVWSVMTCATVWLARKCYFIIVEADRIMEADREATRLNTRKEK